MRWVYLAIAAILGTVFLRTDMQLVDLVVNANLKWSFAAILLLSGILIGQMFRQDQVKQDTLRIAGWGLFVTLVLGMLEYSVEWRHQTLLAKNQTVLLSAPTQKPLSQHYITAQNGLFKTVATFNGAPKDALIDTGASLVLVNYETAQAAGINVEALSFDTTVTTASGSLNIAQVTLDEIRLGRAIIARNVQAAVTPKGMAHSNLLGGSFLAQMEQTMLQKTQMVLSQRQP